VSSIHSALVQANSKARSARTGIKASTKQQGSYRPTVLHVVLTNSKASSKQQLSKATTVLPQVLDGHWSLVLGGSDRR
jgi:hypothetical protein